MLVERDVRHRGPGSTRFFRVAAVSAAAMLLVSGCEGLGEDNSPAGSGPAASEVVITGSRIVANGFTAPTPVSVVGAERLQERAATNVGDVLNELPAFRGTQTPAAQGLTGGYVGGRLLDLRGLGPVRTLVLVDGKRAFSEAGVPGASCLWTGDLTPARIPPHSLFVFRPGDERIKLTLPWETWSPHLQLVTEQGARIFRFVQ